MNAENLKCALLETGRKLRRAEMDYLNSKSLRRKLEKGKKNMCALIRDSKL